MVGSSVGDASPESETGVGVGSTVGSAAGSSVLGAQVGSGSEEVVDGDGTLGEESPSVE